MHKQQVYKNAPAYVNGVSEEIFKVGMCLPAGPYVTDDDVRYICDCIKDLIEKQISDCTGGRITMQFDTASQTI